MNDGNVVVYGLGISTFVRTVRMALIEKGVAHRLEPCEFGSDALRAVHPFVKMPAFRHGGFHLYETAAIVEYVEDAFAGPRLSPTTAAERAVMRQWIGATNAYLYPRGIANAVVPYFTAQMSGQAPDMAAIKAALPALEQALTVFEAGLAGRPYFCGTTVTLADLFVHPVLFYLMAIPETAEVMGRMPRLRDMLGAIEARPAAAETKPM
jgi:glutathione S-transferase